MYILWIQISYKMLEIIEARISFKVQDAYLISLFQYGEEGRLKGPGIGNSVTKAIIMNFC